MDAQTKNFKTVKHKLYWAFFLKTQIEHCTGAQYSIQQKGRGNIGKAGRIRRKSKKPLLPQNCLPSYSIAD